MALREIPAGLTLGAILGTIGVVRIVIWQKLGFYDYGEHWFLVAATVGTALVGIVLFGSLTGSMLPFILQRVGFDPATASAPFVATLVDVSAGDLLHGGAGDPEGDAAVGYEFGRPGFGRDGRHGLRVIPGPRSGARNDADAHGRR